MAIKKLFTSESVTEGHPDKLCDQVSDGVLDAVLAQDQGCQVDILRTDRVIRQVMGQEQHRRDPLVEGQRAAADPGSGSAGMNKNVAPFYLYVNVTTPEMLRKVLANPKKYAPSGVYIMRIHGTFVNFLDLSPAIQQDIITRLDPQSTSLC